MAPSHANPTSFPSIVERSSSASGPHTHGRQCIYFSLCFFPTLFIFSIFILAAYFTISLHSNLLPIIPSFHLRRLNTTDISLTPVENGDGAAYAYGTVDVAISVWNEKAAEIKFSVSKLFVMAYGETLIFEEAMVPGFWQAANSSEEVRVTAEVREKYLTAKQVSELEMGMFKGEMLMDVEWEVNADFVTAGEFFRSVPLNVACNRVNTSALLVGDGKQCTAKLLGLFSFA